MWQAFGPDTANASDGAGQLIFGDGRLLCLPVRSLHGTFAWVSCPLALARYARDHAAAGLPAPATSGADKVADDHIALPAATAAIASGNTVYLEDLDLAVDVVPNLAPLADAIGRAALADEEWHGLFAARFGVVSDTTFTFLAETATVVTARIKLDDGTKTVATGALWYEEAIPAESIFSTPLLAMERNGSDSAALFELLAAPLAGVAQIGGNASVGRGLMKLRLVGAQP